MRSKRNTQGTWDFYSSRLMRGCENIANEQTRYTTQLKAIHGNECQRHYEQLWKHCVKEKQNSLYVSEASVQCIRSVFGLQFFGTYATAATDIHPTRGNCSLCRNVRRTSLNEARGTRKPVWCKEEINYSGNYLVYMSSIQISKYEDACLMGCI
jgi:hypothetical protein